MIGIVGCGNMARAIVKGYYGKNPDHKIMAYNPTKARAVSLAQDVGGVVAEGLSDLTQASTIVIACKPQHFKDLVANLKQADVNLSDKHVVSIMAAIPLKRVQESLGSMRVSRVMPNTPALLGAGMSLVLHAAEVSNSERQLVEKFFSACGEIANLDDEETFDKVTTVSGSGPAYVFLFAQSMVQQLSEWGLDESQARKIVVQLFSGSSQLMQEKAEAPLQELIDQVTSKGGVTIEAVKAYRERHLEEITAAALGKAVSRSAELRNLFNT